MNALGQLHAGTQGSPLISWAPACIAIGLLLTGCAATSRASESAFGVVARTSNDHRPCVTFGDMAKFGEHVRVILFPSRQAVGATVLHPVAECGFGQEPGHAYSLQFDKAVEDGGLGSVAVRGNVPSSITFQQCAGSEALHLTAWKQGRRIWHGFYYLGYDVEPDCGPGEID